MKIRRRCACGCNGITNYGRKYINWHNKPHQGHKHSKEAKLKISLVHKGQKLSEEHKRKISLAHKGKTLSEETKKKMSIAGIKCNPNYEYCDVWKDSEYRKDLRKDYCENLDCKKNSKKLNNHHIYLDKKRCAPQDIITLCISCHMILHRLLESISTNPKDYIIINRISHVSYIYKLTRKTTKIERTMHDKHYLV